MGITIKMLNPEVFFLVTCMALATAIRVDFGTKQGPIVPPTPTTTVRPQPPFRDPAPVWEDQSDDIPNPNPYQYVLPPPSRPKPTTNTYQASRPSSARDLVFGSVIAPNEINSLFGSNTVASLSPQYVPNFGFKYNAVVPSKAKTYYSKSANVYYNDKFSKFNGKYNAKTKKYKAYEKVKYIPDVYYSNIVDLPALSFEQQLPSLQPPKPFRLPEVAQPLPTFNYGPSKVAYSKNDLYALSKNYKTHQPQKRHTLAYESMRTRR